MKASSALWTKAKDLLLPYDGMASQIYVFGLPLSELGNAIDDFCAAVSNPVVIALDREWDEGVAVTSEMREVLIASSVNATHQVLISPLKKASLTGFHATAKHIAAKVVSPSSETMRTI